MEYVLRTDQLCKQYKNFKALDRLSMHVNKGSIYGFVGKNGAGKTTLIRLACGLQRPTSGSYALYGIPHTDSKITSARRRMGAVVETPSIYLELTAEDNLRQQYQILGRPSFDGIPELLKLVGIAVALAGNPDFLALDEPVNGLDPQGIVEVRELILKLNREHGITVLISSHILDELARLATHYGFIDRGQMVKEISAADLEKACRKCMRLQVSDIKALARVLDARKLEYAIRNGHEADVYGSWNVTELTLALAEEHCEIQKIAEHDETLESYYINLMGGGGHE